MSASSSKTPANLRKLLLIAGMPLKEPVPSMRRYKSDLAEVEEMSTLSLMGVPTRGLRKMTLSPVVTLSGMPALKPQRSVLREASQNCIVQPAATFGMHSLKTFCKYGRHTSGHLPGTKTVKGGAVAVEQDTRRNRTEAGRREIML